MVKKYFLCVLLILPAIYLYGQCKLEVSHINNMEKEVPEVYPDIPDNQALVVVKSNVKLNFESTLDDDVNPNSTEESGFIIYHLLFSTDKKYEGRTLIIKSNGCIDYPTEQLYLKAKESIEFKVMAHKCYYDKMNEGNRFYENSQYNEAKNKYRDAGGCTSKPEGNDFTEISNKVDNCIETLKKADDYYDAGNFIEAEQWYGSLYRLNSNDTYAKNRAIDCKTRQEIKIFFENLPDTIEFRASGGEKSITVNYNATAWKISGASAWCSTTKTDNLILFSCKANPNSQERNEIFYITVNEESKAVNIRQKGIASLDSGNWEQAIIKVISHDNTTESTNEEETHKHRGEKDGLGVECIYNIENIDDIDSYWGHFQQGKKNGKGIYIIHGKDYYYPNRDGCKYYAGEWNNNKIDGTGKCYDETGKMIYSGLFDKGKPTGTYPQSYDDSFKFEYREYDNGDIYFGETYQGVEEGLGIFFGINGDVWYGEWKTGKRNGNGIEFQHNDSIKTGKWDDDIYWQDTIVLKKEFKQIVQTEDTIKPKPVILPPLTRIGKKIYLNGNKLPEKRVEQIMANVNTNAFTKYHRGISHDKKGTHLIVFGTLILAGGTTMKIIDTADPTLVNWAYYDHIIWSVIGTGAALIIPGIALKISGKSKIRKAVNIYNNTGKMASVELKGNFTGDGLKFTLNF